MRPCGAARSRVRRWGHRDPNPGLEHLHVHSHDAAIDTGVIEPMKNKQKNAMLLQPSRSYQAMLLIQTVTPRWLPPPCMLAPVDLCPFTPFP